MRHAAESFTTSDGPNIHTESWLPDGEAKAAVIIVHGYAEHIGRYQWHAELLVEHGYAVYGLDHRGHGKSSGLQAYLDDFDAPISDLETYFNQVKTNNKKVFVWGHSMGSLIGLGFALHHQSELAGLVLTGTAVNADERVSPLVTKVIGVVLNALVPKRPLIPALPSSTLSHDPAVVAAYDSDPLIYRGPWRVRTVLRLLNYGENLRSRAAELTLPLLVMHGSEDEVVPKSGSEFVYTQARSADKTLKIYPALYHEIHNEVEKATVLMDIVNWLDQH